MGVLYYYHYHPISDFKSQYRKWSKTPLPYDMGENGYFSDRIYNARNSASRFYVVTLGYENSWAQNNLIGRVVDRYTIHFAFSGKGIFNGKPVHGGQFFIAPHNKEYSIIRDPDDPLVFGWSALSGTELENQLSIFHLPPDEFIGTLNHSDEIRDIFIDAIYREHDISDIEYFLLGTFFNLLYLGGMNVYSRSPANSIPNHYLSDAISYINIHFANNISVADISDYIHISESYLRKLFSENFGKSPLDSITEKRISVAKNLLQNFDMPIISVSHAVGYSDQGAFSKVFKKSTGMSPKDFRITSRNQAKDNAKSDNK